MPIASDRQVRPPGARVFRPRWLLDLAVPIEAAQPAAAGAGEVVKFTIPVSRFSLTRNDHNEADVLEVTADWHFAGTDPRLIQSAIGTFYIGEAAPGEKTWSPSDADIRFVGVMMRAKRVGTERGLEDRERVAHQARPVATTR